MSKFVSYQYGVMIYDLGGEKKFLEKSSGVFLSVALDTFEWKCFFVTEQESLVTLRALFNCNDR